MDEKAYLAGRAAAATDMLKHVMGLLPAGREKTAAAMAAELSETRAVLRLLCAEFGDNNWDDTLHLADVVEKHLCRYARPRARSLTASAAPPCSTAAGPVPAPPRQPPA